MGGPHSRSGMLKINLKTETLKDTKAECYRTMTVSNRFAGYEWVMRLNIVRLLIKLNATVTSG
jgi:hypothetical protein